MELRSLLLSLVRNKWLFLGTVLGIFAIGAIVIFMLPDVYSSKAKILIERPNTYSQAGVPVAKDNLSQRMHAIIATVMSTGNIQRVIKKHELLDPDAGAEELAQATEDFRDKAQLLFDNVAIINDFSGRQALFSQGMTVEFESSDADTAFAVTQTLTNNVLQANSGKGEDSATYRRSFLTKETERLRAELDAAEKKVAGFKENNATYLPELNPAAIRRLDEIESQIQRSNDSASRLRREAANNAADLATASKDSIIYGADGRAIRSSEEQLRELELEYATQSAKYSKDHPTLKRLAASINAMKRLVNSSDTSGIEAELRSTRTALNVALQRYSAQHPDVKKLQNRVEGLKRSLKSQQASSRPRSTSKPNSPAYNRFLIRQQSLRDDIAREEENLSSLQGEKLSLNEQLSKMPFVEQQLTSLERNRQNTQTSYQEVQAELSAAERSFGMREADLLERFELIEPPVRAFKPSAPRRELLLPVLGILSFGLGLLLVLVKHTVQDRVCRSSDIEAIIDAPVLLVPEFS